MIAHNQWASRPQDQRFETLAALRESVHNRRLVSRAVDIDIAKIQVQPDEENNSITVNGSITPCEPSHWSFGQLCSWAKVNGVTAPANYLRTLSPVLVARNLNYALGKTKTEALKFMTCTREGESSNTLQAVTSPTYGRIWDADVCDCVSRLVDRSGGRWFNPKAYVPGENRVAPQGLYASDHDVFIFMIDGGSRLEAGPRAQLNRGFIVGNSETGAKTFYLMQFMFNAVCGNHIIWGMQNVNEIVIRHTSGGPARFDALAAPALIAYANASAAPELAAIKRAQDYLLPMPYHADKSGAVADKHIIDFAQGKGKFSRSEIKEAIAFARREEGDCRTLWQLVQGGTAYARGFEYIDTRTETETRFSSLLDIVKN